MTKSFTNSPGQLGVVLCYVACSDGIASELHEAIDKFVKQVVAEHGLAAENNLPI